jgi:hypothetical protein
VEPEDEIRRGPAQKTIALFSKVTRVECSSISVASSREGSMPLVAVPDEREIQKVNAASILQQEVTADAPGDVGSAATCWGLCSLEEADFGDWRSRIVDQRLRSPHRCSRHHASSLERSR